MSPDNPPRLSDEHLRQIRMIEVECGNGQSLLHGREVVALIDDLAAEREKNRDLEAKLADEHGAVEVWRHDSELFKAESERLRAALELADQACGNPAERVANDCDHHGLKHAGWYLRVRRYRKARAALEPPAPSTTETP